MSSCGKMRSCGVVFSTAEAVADFYRDRRLPLWWSPRSITINEMSGSYDRLVQSLGTADKHLNRVAVLRTAFENICVVYENGKLGVDFGNMSQISAHLNCDAIKVMDNGIAHQDLVTSVYQKAASWEHVNARKSIRRSVHVVSEDGRWHFEQNGEPLSYENTELYQIRRKADRMNGSIIEEYFDKLQAPVLDSRLTPRSDILKWIKVSAG